MNKTTNHLTAFECLILILLNVYTSGTLTNNLEEGNTVASILNDLKDDITVLNVLESTLKKSVIQCSNDADCYYAGKCTKLEDGLKVCECRNGTSGALCQDVDECVADPDKCGNGTDVQCVFDVIQEEAICKCDNASKQFDYYTETCMVPCKTFSNCTQNGYCFKNEKSKLSKHYFCRCKPGARGDFCEIIDQCQSKEVDCGSDPGVICALGKNGQAYCKCKDTKQGFDYDSKICKNCNCGEGFVSCKFENGTKFCDCNWRYKQRFSECAVCDCGYYANNCSFNAAGEKKCDCKPYYIESQSGQCIDECDRKSCQNGGTCDKVCHCPKGTSGDYCQNVDWCEDFRCGDHYETMCIYNPETTMGECKCRDKNSVYDDNAKNCFECDCGRFGNCTYANGFKVCKCQEGYSFYKSKCQECDCGKMAISCSFKNGEKKCSCKEKYISRTSFYAMYGQDTRCDECDCGEHGKCSFEDDEKQCTCREHYLLHSGKCEKCFCGPHGTCKFENDVTEPICTCDYGYVVQDGICVKCDCDPPGLRGIGTKCSIKDGVKHCECPRGFISQYGSCEDIDECLQFSLCPSNTNCVNVPGSYQCECKMGYELWREDDDPKVDGCKDVDECFLGGTCVSATTLCVNTPGSYDCVCREGYYATAAVQGDTYMPMYNACYGKETQWKAAAITLAVIMVLGCLLISCFIFMRKK